MMLSALVLDGGYVKSMLYSPIMTVCSNISVGVVVAVHKQST